MVHFQSSPWGFNTVQLRSRLSYHLKVNPMPFAVVMANVCPCTARRQPLGCSNSKKFGKEWEKMGPSLRKFWDSWGSGRYASSGREGQEFWLWLWTFEGNWGANGVKWSGNSYFSFILKSSSSHSKIQVLNWLVIRLILSWVCILCLWKAYPETSPGVPEPPLHRWES